MVGEKIGETEKSPNGKVERSKLIGEKIRNRKIPPIWRMEREKIVETGELHMYNRDA